MMWDFSNPMFPKPRAEKRRSLVRWQVELERTRESLERSLRAAPNSNVRSLEWSEKRGCIDIVFNDGTRKAVFVQGDSPVALTHDILQGLFQFTHP